MLEVIERKLQALNPSELKITDESHNHAGHEAMRSVNKGQVTHIKVTIAAECFSGLSKIKRHQLIYKLLAEELKLGLHSISIIDKLI